MKNEEIADVSAIYKKRFSETGLDKRDRVWRVLVDNYFQQYFPSDGSVLDLACGYGEFTRNIRAASKFAVDLNEDAEKYLPTGVNFRRTYAQDLDHIPESSLDRAFTSNFLEHLPDKQTCDAVLKAVLRVLKPGGKFVIMGPNIRFCYDLYWDFYDHYLALSDRSLAEGLSMNGYEVETVIPQFLPFTMAARQPTNDFLIRTYLAVPFAWRIFGKQFLLVGRKPASR